MAWKQAAAGAQCPWASKGSTVEYLEFGAWALQAIDLNFGILAPPTDSRGAALSESSMSVRLDITAPAERHAALSACIASVEDGADPVGQSTSWRARLHWTRSLR